MQDINQIKERFKSGDVIVLLQDSFGEPHERVRTVFEDVESLEVYKYHHMSDEEIENARVEIHDLRTGQLAKR